MFCSNCGKAVEQQWVKCPYCGENLKSEDNSETRKNSGNVNEKQSVKKVENNNVTEQKKKVPLIIGIGIAIIAIMLFVGNGTDNVVDLSSYEGGYAGWEASGFEGSVRTDITIPYPITNTEKNNYAVYIGAGKNNVGVIGQADGAAISEWKWLMNAQPDNATQAYYFNCTLTYTGHNVEDYGFPLFIIDDAQPCNPVTDDIVDSNNELDMAMYVGGSINTLLQADNSFYIDSDGMFYNDVTGSVTISVTDGSIDMVVIGEKNDGKIKFAGVSVGDSAENIEDGRVEKAGYTYYMDDESGVLYMYSDGNSGVIYLLDANGCVNGINWMSNMGEMVDIELQNNTDYATNGNMENIDVDYGHIYGGILDGIIGNLDAGINSDELSYAFYDIDKDGYMEFFIENGQLEYEVWTTTGEGCSYLGVISDARNIGLYAYMNGNGVYTDFCHMGCEIITLVDSIDGMLMYTPIFNGENLEEYGYHSDGTPFDELAYPIEIHSLQEGLIW